MATAKAVKLQDDTHSIDNTMNILYTKLDEAIDRILMLHAYMFTQSGIPVLYSGDEIGQLNDNEYALVPEKAPDSRYIHRGKFQWDMAAKIKEKGSVQERLF